MKPYDLLLPVVLVHAGADMFMTKSYDLKLHHACVFGVIFYNNYHNVLAEDRFLFLYPLINTEITSIFYVLKYWLPSNTWWYHANTLLFYVSFLKLRIYDFYWKVIYNHIPFDILIQKYSETNYYTSSILVLSCYGLYTLNLYWFSIMNKILYKTISKVVHINTSQLCHQLCGYLHWVNIPVAVCIYAFHPRQQYIFDVVGITVLSVYSYQYHREVYQRLRNKEIPEYDIPGPSNMTLFFNDTLAIHVRSILAITTNYYHSEYFLGALAISTICHVSSAYQSTLNMFELLTDAEKHKSTFFGFHNMYSAIPIACDVGLIFMNSSTEIAIPFLLVNIMIGIVVWVEPFYKLSHVAFHVLLIFQNYYMVWSNTR